ncbi:ImmA/IrrE family metallo-endopeptidase [Sutcliffiella cohnii]|uniref:ImmA/IrrE family metallo-endopeptidase n=1 Tax=Sutcliffiella cohnii TaxID=33932 RepID=UPI002E2315D1|nr:ImmA/IrrE family metallo-endopeptidase [Sutcliffiella cohnii]
MATIPQLSMTEIRDIETKVLAKIGSLRKSGRIIREEVLSLLEEEATLLKYPIEDDELCAFVCKKQDKLFVYINTHIPKEKQIFAAAHELYHIWFDQDRLSQSEMLKSNTLENETEDINELRANLFAAMFLVPKEVLINQLESLGIEKHRLKIEDIVKLMPIFLVPYKTIVRRLHEIDYISDRQLKEFLTVPDRDPNKGVLLFRKILQLNDSSQERTQEIFFEGLVENSIKLFQNGQIDERKLSYLLSLVRKSPSDFGITSHELTDEDWEAIMEDYDGDD